MHVTADPSFCEASFPSAGCRTGCSILNITAAFCARTSSKKKKKDLSLKAGSHLPTLSPPCRAVDIIKKLEKTQWSFFFFMYLHGFLISHQHGVFCSSGHFLFANLFCLSSKCKRTLGQGSASARVDWTPRAAHPAGGRRQNRVSWIAWGRYF